MTNEPMILNSVLPALADGTPLNYDQAAFAMSIIADGHAPTPEIVQFLRAYIHRRPTTDELTAFVQTLRKRMIHVTPPAANTVCNCGTGGDGRGTANISTIAAFVVAAAGIPVAKHGNRSVSSQCGSTDVLTALGVAACNTPDQAHFQLTQANLCFLNAPDFHPALRHVADARTLLARQGHKTIFNLLGPLLNPASVRRQSMGVFDESLLETVAQVLANTGTRRAYLFSGDGLDELTLTGLTTVFSIDVTETIPSTPNAHSDADNTDPRLFRAATVRERSSEAIPDTPSPLGTATPKLTNAREEVELTKYDPRNSKHGSSTVRTFTVHPSEFGLPPCTQPDLRGGDAKTNAHIAEDVLSNNRKGPIADTVILNAAAAIGAGAVDPITIKDALPIAREALRSGKAHQKLTQMRRLSPTNPKTQNA